MLAKTRECHGFLGEAGAVWTIFLRLRVKQELHPDSDDQESPEDFEDGSGLRGGLQGGVGPWHELSSEPGQATGQGQRGHDMVVVLYLMAGRMGAMHVDEQHQSADQGKLR